MSAVDAFNASMGKYGLFFRLRPWPIRFDFEDGVFDGLLGEPRA
jgi:hypothetical protein